MYQYLCNIPDDHCLLDYRELLVLEDLQAVQLLSHLQENHHTEKEEDKSNIKK